MRARNKKNRAHVVLYYRKSKKIDDLRFNTWISIFRYVTILFIYFILIVIITITTTTTITLFIDGVHLAYIYIAHITEHGTRIRCNMGRREGAYPYASRQGLYARHPAEALLAGIPKSVPPLIYVRT